MLVESAVRTVPFLKGESTLRNWEAKGLQTPNYESPTVTDYGDLQEITANNAVPQFVDVPQGTPISEGPIVGSDPFPQMS